jgi:D-3-phosphoglycerate dehydrogenase
MKERILFTNPGIHEFLPKELTALGYQCDFDYESTKAQIEEKMPNYIGVVMKSRFDADKSFFKKAKNLKFLARVGVGFEHIDVKYAQKQGIEIILSPEGSRDAVGEHTLGLLLCLFNNLAKGDREIKEGKWIRSANRGVEIKGKRIGIIGFGNMGKSFAKRLVGFGAKVMAYDKYKSNYSKKYAMEVSLETLFKESDVISVHIPYDADNHHFINKAFIKKFAKPIYILNTARGLVLNTEDLVWAMKKGKVLGAGLDVLEYEAQSFEKFEQEGMPAPFQYLIQSDKVVLSPHIAGWTMESKLKHAQTIVKKIGELKNK